MGGVEATLARGAQVLVALTGAYLVALWFVLVVWTYRDIEARSRNVVTQLSSTLLVVLFWVPGILLYMILRPKETLDAAYQRSLEEEYLLQDLEELPLCPQCQRYVEDDFILCPHCQATLREPCLACARLVDLRWSRCPYCGVAQDGKEAGEQPKVEQPAARWVAPGLRRRRGEAVSPPALVPEIGVAASESRPLTVVAGGRGAEVTVAMPSGPAATATPAVAAASSQAGGDRRAFSGRFGGGRYGLSPGTPLGVGTRGDGERDAAQRTPEPAAGRRHAVDGGEEREPAMATRVKAD